MRPAGERYGNERNFQSCERNLQSMIESPMERARRPTSWQRNARQCCIPVDAETLTGSCRKLAWKLLTDYLMISRSGPRYRIGHKKPPMC